MKTSLYEFSEKEVRKHLLPRLIGTVFHVTRRASLDGIKERGCIDPNRDGALGNSLPQSSNSFGRANGYVCLFDFRDKSTEAISWGLDCFNFLENRSFGDEIALLELDPIAFPQLIPAGSAYARGGAGTIWVPDVECWFPGPLPFDLISDVLQVTIHRTPIPPDSLVAALLAMDEKHGKCDG